MNSIKKMIKSITDYRYKERKSFSYFINRNCPVIYRIRFFNGEGLMSMLYKACEQVEYAEMKGYIPMIDLEHYPSIYRKPNQNTWELFFSQPKAYQNLLEEHTNVSQNLFEEHTNESRNLFEEHTNISQKRYRYITSACFNPIPEKMELFNRYWAYDFDRIREKGAFFHRVFSVNPNILEKVDKLAQELNIGECIGVLARGTDYVALKPQGHPVQPEVEELCQYLESIIDKGSNRIFLVTEDTSIKEKLENRFPGAVFSLQEDITFAPDTGKHLLYETIQSDNILKVAETYLIKICLLSRCKSLVGGRTNGSMIAWMMNEDTYEHVYLFDKGVY